MHHQDDRSEQAEATCGCGHDHTQHRIHDNPHADPPGGGRPTRGRGLRQERLVIQGLHCADCAAKVEKTLTRLPGVTLAAVNFATSALSIEYDPAVLKRGEIGRAVGQLGYGVAQPAGPRAARGSVLRLTGLDCPDCAAKLEKSLRSRPGVKRADLNFAASKLVIEHSGPVEEVIAAVRAAGYGAELAAPGPTPVAWSPFSAADPKFVLTALSGVALLAGIIAGRTGLGRSGQAAIFAVALATGGYTVARAGLFSLRHLVLDMNVLVTIAALGAAAIDRWEEAATVVFLFSFGNLLEAYSLDRTRRSIRNLMQSAPQAAVVRREGREVTVPVEEVGEGETLIVRPGDRLAADGVVVAGASPVNQAMITGESLSVVKEKGAAVYAGTINEDGYLEVQVTAKAADSTLARIVHLVEEAQGQRAPTQQFVDTFARYYTPIVIGLAVAVAVLPSLVLRQPFTPWFYRSLALLVVSCPCALVVSTPVSIVSAIGNAARSGIMIKGGVHLEAIGKIRSIALDKTGTLTLGRPQVAGVVPASGRGEEEVLRAAAGVEARSEHALARAIVEAAGRQGIAPPAGENFVALPGRGAKAKVDGVNVYVGRPEFARDQLGLDLSGFREALEAARGKGRTAVVVGTKGFLLGLITFTDTPRPEAAAAVADLKRAGVRPVVMLTGDAEGAAALIGRRLGLDEVRAGLLPEDKVAAVRRLMADYGQVAMVGDGINDAPALAAASVGVAMGVVGSDAALETADIALMADDLTRVAYAVRLGRRTVATVRENIIFSLLVKVAALALIFPGWLTLWLAVMSDVGASLVVTLNGLRLLSFGGSRRAAQAAGPSPAEAIQTGS